MRKRYVSLGFALMVTATLLAGCGSSSSNSSTASSATTAVEGQASNGADTSKTDTIDKDALYGQVKSVDGNTITIETGTMKERSFDASSGATAAGNEQEAEGSSASSGTESSQENPSSESAGNPDEVSSATKSETGGFNPGMQSDMLDLTGEEKELTVNDDTVIQQQGMGQFSPDGKFPSKPDDSTGATSSTAEEGEVPAGFDGNPPSMPSGSDGNPPSMPSGSDGNRPSMPDGSTGMPSMEATDAELSDIQEGDLISYTCNEDGSLATVTILFSKSMAGNMGAGQPGGMTSAKDISYSAVKEYTTDTESSDETFSSTGADESAILVSNGASVKISGAKIERSSDDSTGGDNASFYGVGAAVLTTEGTTTVKDSKITTDSAGGAGVFAYGEKSKVKVSDTIIKTQQDTSGGIHVAGGGTLEAENVTVETNGSSSAAIRSDRGGGTMIVNGGTYITNGDGSPAIYSTANISVNNAVLEATDSEAVCVEGMNSLSLTDCSLTGNIAENQQNDCSWNVIVYQSTSGDAEDGNGKFTMDGGSLTAQNGGMFYTTNTESTFVLKNVDLTYAEDAPFFLKCTGNANQRGWGTSGANGADCKFTAISQEMEGDILWDSISTLDFYMTQDSKLTGAILDDESCVTQTGTGSCNLHIEEGSTWVVTEDSRLTTLENAGKIVDEDGDSVTIQDTDGTTIVDGDSDYVITVDSYKTTVDLSAATSLK